MGVPRFSIVIPAYDAARTIGATIRSVLGQTFTDFELLVIDDGSQDGTGEVVLEAAAEDPRLRLTRQQNLGPAAARNAALGAASGELISVLDADDLWLPGYLAEMDRALAGAGPAIGYCDAWILDDDSQKVHRLTSLGYEPPIDPQLDSSALLELLLRGNFLINSTVTFPRDAIERIGGYDPTLHGGEDYELWLRLAAAGHGGVRAKGCQAVVRDRAGSQSKDLLMMHRSVRALLERFGETPGLSVEATAAIDSRLEGEDHTIRALSGGGTAATLLRLRRALGHVKGRLRRGRLRKPPTELSTVLAADPPRHGNGT